MAAQHQNRSLQEKDSCSERTKGHWENSQQMNSNWKRLFGHDVSILLYVFNDFDVAESMMSEAKWEVGGFICRNNIKRVLKRLVAVAIWCRNPLDRLFWNEAVQEAATQRHICDNSPFFMLLSISTDLTWSVFSEQTPLLFCVWWIRWQWSFDASLGSSQRSSCFWATDTVIASSSAKLLLWLWLCLSALGIQPLLRKRPFFMRNK